MTDSDGVPEGDDVECAKCERSVPIDDAVMLTHKTSKALWKYLCPSCLKEMGVPKGYDLERDVTHLNPTSDSLDETEADNTADTTRSVIADFRGQVATADMPSGEMQQGRIVMNESQLVLVSGDHRTPIRLDRIIDIHIQQASKSTQEYFDDVVKLAYETASEERSAFIGASAEIIDTFTSIIFKGVLNGSAVRVTYPTNVGGQPKETNPRQGSLRISDGKLTVDGIAMPPEIDPQNVVDMGKRRRDWPKTKSFAFEVVQREFEGLTTAGFEFPSNRILNLVGRYLNRTYGERMVTVRSAALDDRTLQILATIWALGTVDSVPSIVDVDETTTSETVADLRGEGFLKEGESPELTTEGVIAVIEYVETVNS